MATLFVLVNPSGCTTERELIDVAVGAPVAARLSVPNTGGSGIPADVPTNVMLRVRLDRLPAEATVTAENVSVECGGEIIPADVEYDARFVEIVVVPESDLPTRTDCAVVLAARGLGTDTTPRILFDEDLRLSFRTAGGQDDSPPSFDATPAVVACGNGVLGGGEQCDTVELGGNSCAAFGFAGGNLTCAPDCTFDFSGCTMPASCGDGTCAETERCTSCPADCGACCATAGFPSSIPDTSPFVLRFDSLGVSDDTSSELGREIRFEAFVATVSGGQDFTTASDVTPTAQTRYRILGLQPETEYFVVLRVTDMAGNFTDSIELSATTGSAVANPDDFTEIYEAIVCDGCLECHDPSRRSPPPQLFILSSEGAPPSAFLTLFASREVPTLKLIEPGDAARSYMVLKMLGNAATPLFGHGIVGQMMPAGSEEGLVACFPPVGPGSEPLQRLIAWIDSGAPDSASRPVSCP